MAKIVIQTTKEEQDIVVKALKKIGNVTVAVSRIADVADIKQSRVRYILTDLIDSGRVSKIPTKAFNKHYIRYSYKVNE